MSGTARGPAGEPAPFPGEVRLRTTADLADPRLEAFWTRRLLCSLTTLRPDGTPHVVPVGATLDVPAGLVRVITSGDSRKARHVERAYRAIAHQLGHAAAGDVNRIQRVLTHITRRRVDGLAIS